MIFKRLTRTSALALSSLGSSVLLHDSRKYSLRSFCSSNSSSSVILNSSSTSNLSSKPGGSTDTTTTTTSSASSIGQFALPNVVDSFRGVNIDLSSKALIASGGKKNILLLSSLHVFRESLHMHLQQWKSERYRAVWLKIPTEHAALIPAAVQEGFVFHHAEATHAVLVNWLPKLDLSLAAQWDQVDHQGSNQTADNSITGIDDIDRFVIQSQKRSELVQKTIAYIDATPLPANASHQVGVGCVVMHPQVSPAEPAPAPSSTPGSGLGLSSGSGSGSQTAAAVTVRPRILAVQERRGPLRGQGVWKLPTGLINQGEDISEGAVREVREETGVDTVFRGIVAIRHAHGALHDKSDLFYVCLLEAVPPVGTVSEGADIPISLQREELEACQWLDLDSYLEQERYQQSPLYSRINEAIKVAVLPVLESGTESTASIAPPHSHSMFVHQKLRYGYSYYKGKDCSLYHSIQLLPVEPGVPN